jgi:hypothetical protein
LIGGGICIVETRRQFTKGVMVEMQAQSELLHVVSALHSSSSFTRRLNGGKQQTDQDADDGDND